MGGISSLVSLLCMIAVSSLNIGDTAPSLEGTQWLKGKAPVFTDQVTIVEIWRSSCGNCKKQIPHLSALQQKYGDRLSVVTISKDPLETMEEYIKANDSQMNFTVGNASKEITDRYMEGVTGVPYAFLINRDGLIIWKGHPAGIDDILDKTIAGNIDIEKLKKISRLENSLSEALETNDPDIIAPINQSLLAEDPSNEQGLEIGMRLAIYNSEPVNVKELFDRIKLEGLGGRKASSFAKMLVTESDFEYRYPEAALKFSLYALEQDPKNDVYMDIHARVLYCLGDIDKAIFWEKMAVALDQEESSYQQNLDYYLSIKAIRDKNGYNANTGSQGSKVLK